MLESILQTSVTNIILSLLNVLTGILLARLLGPVNRGELAAAQMLPGIISSVALLGLPEAVVYWISYDKKTSKQTITTTLLMFLPLSVFGYLVGYVLMPLVLSAQSEHVVQLARIYMLVIFYSSFGSIYVVGLQGLRDFKPWNLMRLFPPAMWLVAILSGYALKNLSPTYLLIFTLIFPVPFVFLFMYYFWRKIEGPLAFSSKRLWQLLNYGLPVTLTAVPQTLNLRLDQLLMAAFLSPGLLGLYVVGVTWSSASSVILSAFSSVITPNLAAPDIDNMQEQKIGMITRSSILLVSVIVIAQVILTPFAIPLIFGKPYAPAVPAAIVLVVAGGITGLGMLWKGILYGLGDPKPVLVAEIAGLIMTFIALAILLVQYQIVGAALASLLSYSVTLIYLTLIIGRRVKKPISFFLLPSYADVVWMVSKLDFLLRRSRASIVH